MSKEALAEVEATADDTSAEASKAHEQSLDDAMSVLASDQDWAPDPADRGDFLPETPEPEVPVELDAVEKPVEVEQEFEDEGVVQEAAPEPEAEKPQLLDSGAHEFIWQLLGEQAVRLPMGVGYNSMGGYASVNHQHFQTFVSRKKYPVELSCWEHNGGNLSYPVNCKKFFDAAEAWSHINMLHEANVPYNLLFRNGEMYCVTRRFQGSYVHADWTSGFAWSEVNGAVSIADREIFNQLTETDVEAELKKLQRL